MSTHCLLLSKRGLLGTKKTLQTKAYDVILSLPLFDPLKERIGIQLGPWKLILIDVSVFMGEYFIDKRTYQWNKDSLR